MSKPSGLFLVFWQMAECGDGLAVFRSCALRGRSWWVNACGVWSLAGAGWGLGTGLSRERSRRRWGMTIGGGWAVLLLPLDGFSLGELAILADTGGERLTVIWKSTRNGGKPIEVLKKAVWLIWG